MGIFDKNRFAGASNNWNTPDNIFIPLNDEFHFEYDLACDHSNRLCQKGFTEEEDSLKQSWSGIGWLNPPFANVKKWVKKAYEESKNNGTVIVMLVASKTNTIWWHEYVMKSKEIRYIKGRPKFKRNGTETIVEHGLPFPLSIVIFGKSDKPTIHTAFDLSGGKKIGY